MAAKWLTLEQKTQGHFLKVSELAIKQVKQHDNRTSISGDIVDLLLVITVGNGGHFSRWRPKYASEN